MKYRMFVDGLCEPRNPGGYGCWGVVVFDESDKEIHTASGCIGHGTGVTNNVAEYAALLAGIGWLETDLQPGTVIEFYSDSQLLVNQINGDWACNAPALRARRDEALSRLATLGDRLAGALSWEITWVPRERNARADALSREGYRQAQQTRIASVKAQAT